MATRNPRQTRKRLRQSTLSALSDSQDPNDSKRGRKSANPRYSWNTEAKGLMFLEPIAWKADTYAALRKPQSLKIAAFDLDSTLITTRSRAKFPKSPTDWRLLNSRVAPNIASLAEQGYIFVVFTNQAGVSNGRMTEEFVRIRMEGIVASLNADIAVFVATSKDNFRKPGTGMWDVFVQLIGGVERIDAKSSFFVGDAAGRPARPGQAKDFSDSDLRFAINIGLRFRTPEEHFFERSSEGVSTQSIVGFDPRLIVNANRAPFLDEHTDMDHILQTIISPPDLVDELNMGASVFDKAPAVQTMVLMHGPPASGKTTFVKRHLSPKGYVWVNFDTLHSIARCSRVTREALNNGKSVVIDNTNADKNARCKYIDLGRNFDENLKIICICMRTEMEVARHLNIVRERESMGNRPHVPLVAFHAHSKRVEEPDFIEKIDRIGEVRFVPRFTCEQERYMFTRLT